ncbi:MAG: hypothetical protein NVS9B9_12690 [Ktedonobacteraceae bacterium]
MVAINKAVKVVETIRVEEEMVIMVIMEGEMVRTFLSSICSEKKRKSYFPYPFAI